MLDLNSQATNVVIARGMPTAGKTSALTDAIALSCDQVKERILEHFNGLNPQQTHFQSAAIIKGFRTIAEPFLKQALTKDSLFLDAEAVELEIKAAKASKQSIRMIDMHVPLRVVCCRMLKRSLYKPRMPFAALKDYYIKMQQNTKIMIDLVGHHQDIFADYQLLTWSERENQFTQAVRLELKAGKRTFVIANEQAFAKLTAPLSSSSALETLTKEIDSIGRTVITPRLIAEITANMPTDAATEFVIALTKYQGRTFQEALQIHSLEPIMTPSPGAREVQTAHRMRMR